MGDENPIERIVLEHSIHIPIRAAIYFKEPNKTFEQAIKEASVGEGIVGRVSHYKSTRLNLGRFLDIAVAQGLISPEIKVHLLNVMQKARSIR